MKNQFVRILKTPPKRFEKSLHKDEKNIHFKHKFTLQTNSGENHKWRRKFEPLQELILDLWRLRCGFLLEGMSYRFQASVGLLSCINITWIQFMYQEFTKQFTSRMFALREQVADYLTAIKKKILIFELFCTVQNFFRGIRKF